MLLKADQTLIINKHKLLPHRGIICAHPDRVKRVAQEYLTDVELHTDYRGFQIFTGVFDQQKIFVANTGIGAPAAAFLIEEMVAFGVKRIFRLGSDDGDFQTFCLKVVEETTLPLGLCADYEFNSSRTLKISQQLKKSIQRLAEKEMIPIQYGKNRHLDGYYAVNFYCKNKMKELGITSQDMESGALYLLAEMRQMECLSLLISYPKHETGGEYLDNGLTKLFEGKAIDFILKILTSNEVI
jgi:purine-nucleoside phosphorylase